MSRRAGAAFGAFPPTAKRGAQQPRDDQAVARLGRDRTVAQVLEDLGFPAGFSPAQAADDDAVSNFIEAMPASFVDQTRTKMSSTAAWAHALLAVSTPASRGIGTFSLRGLSYSDITGALRKLAPLLAQGKWATDLTEYVGETGSANRAATFFLFRVVVVDTLLAANTAAAKPSLRAPDDAVGNMSFADVVCATARKAVPQAFGDQRRPGRDAPSSSESSDSDDESPEPPRRRRKRKKRGRERYRGGSESDSSVSDSESSNEDDSDDERVGAGKSSGDDQASIALLHELGVTNHTTIDGQQAATALKRSMGAIHNVGDISLVVNVIVKVSQRHDINVDGNMQVEPRMAKVIRGIKKICGGEIDASSVDNALPTILRAITTACSGNGKQKRPKIIKELRSAAKGANASLSALAKDATRQSNLARLRGKTGGNGFMQTTAREQALIDQIKGDLQGGGAQAKEYKKRKPGGGERGLAGTWHELLLKKMPDASKGQVWAETDKILGAARLCLGCKKKLQGRCRCGSTSIHADWMAALESHQF